ncbi:MATE family efflux transporter [Bacillus rhizoplanae]|uniref:MATE family efflux transporter n=1 Tax=Bacillus rhizoplanae TaxID=2880966 RepID=UPI003D1C60D9
MKKIDLTKGKVLPVLVSLAIPLIGSSLLQFMYSIIDMLWVGGLGSDAVASIGTATFFIGLGYSIQALVVVGTGIKVSHAIGRKNDLEAKSYIHSGMLLNAFIGLVFSGVLLLFGKHLIGFLHLNNIGVEREAYLFLSISAPMLFFSFFNILYARILSSYGNTKVALKISAIGILINIILDPIFIYSFKLGVLGAGIATLLANFIVFILYHYKSGSLFSITLMEKIQWEKLREIVVLGVPMAAQRILFTVVNIILARMISQFGANAIAAQRIGLQIESIAYMVIGGLNGAVSSFIGQNFGAKQYGRIQKGYYATLLLGSLYTSIMMFLFFLVPDWLASFFIRDQQTIEIASSYLRIIGFSLVFSAVEMISNGFFTGMGMPKIPSFISIIFTVMRIPLALLLIPYFGVNGVWWSISISSMVKGIAAYIMYKTKWREYKNAV